MLCMVAKPMFSLVQTNINCSDKLGTAGTLYFKTLRISFTTDCKSIFLDYST